MAATREMFLAAKLRTKTIPAPELGPGETLTVQEPDDDGLEALNAADFPLDAKGDAAFNRKGRGVRWAIATVRNADGTAMMFTDADAPALAKMSGVLMNRILHAGLELTSGKDPVGAEAKN